MTATAEVESIVDLNDQLKIEQFLYKEARFADEHDFDSWESLWTDDALYWVPIDGLGKDPSKYISIIHDNRSRIHTRLEQLRTGKRYAQAPASNMRRLISNVEITNVEGKDEGSEADVNANFILHEAKERSYRVWAGRVDYRLRVVDGQIKLVRKVVILINNDQAVPNMGFLI